SRQGQRAGAAPLGLFGRGRAPRSRLDAARTVGAGSAGGGEVVPCTGVAMKLWESVLSSASFRVRIALNLKGLSYESIVLDLRAKQHLTEEFGAVNPLRSVPAIEERGMQLFESMAICEWLEETRPEPPLLPFAPAE